MCIKTLTLIEAVNYAYVFKLQFFVILLPYPLLIVHITLQPQDIRPNQNHAYLDLNLWMMPTSVSFTPSNTPPRQFRVTHIYYTMDMKSNLLGLIPPINSSFFSDQPLHGTLKCGYLSLSLNYHPLSYMIPYSLVEFTQKNRCSLVSNSMLQRSHEPVGSQKVIQSFSHQLANDPLLPTTV